jgi:hypothetical protein
VDYLQLNRWREIDRKSIGAAITPSNIEKFAARLVKQAEIN